MNALVGMALVLAGLLGGAFSLTGPRGPSMCTNHAKSAIRDDFEEVRPSSSGTVLQITVSGDERQGHGAASLLEVQNTEPLFSCPYSWTCDDSGLHLKRGECRSRKLPDYQPI